MDVTAYYTHGKVDVTAYYTLSKIAERYDELFNGNYFSPQEDRRHQLKLSGKVSMGDFETFGLVTYKSKAPYLSYVRLEGGDGIGMVDQGNVVRYLPAYFSLDLGVDYAFHVFHQPARIGVSLINATNHTNVEELQHLGKINRDGQGLGFFITHQTELLGRTGNVHFRILF
jgi:hypothetical protein